MIEAHENKKLPGLLVPHLRQTLLYLDKLENIKEYAKKGLVVLRGFANALKVKFAEVEVGIDYTAGAADSGDLEVDLPELLVTVAKAAAAGRTPVAIMIDEMQYLSEIELSALIMAIHQAAQQNLPLVLVGAGLPQLVGLTGRDATTKKERPEGRQAVSIPRRSSPLLQLGGPALEALQDAVGPHAVGGHHALDVSERHITATVRNLIIVPLPRLLPLLQIE